MACTAQHNEMPFDLGRGLVETRVEAKRIVPGALSSDRPNSVDVALYYPTWAKERIILCLTSLR